MSRGIANASASGRLQDDGARENRGETTRQQGRTRHGVSQSGTSRGGPEWNGQSPLPTFVAQVLGQVLMRAPEPRSNPAVAAYRAGAAHIDAGVLFDRGF